MSDSHKKTILIDGDVHPTALSVLEARDDVELAKVPLEDAAALAEAATGANGFSRGQHVLRLNSLPRRTVSRWSRVTVWDTTGSMSRRSPREKFH